jgi:hypothetical protein
VRDISEFKKGDIVTTLGKQTYEVIEIHYGRKKGKFGGVMTICKDVDTGQIYEVSWNQNDIFL